MILSNDGSCGVCVLWRVSKRKSREKRDYSLGSLLSASHNIVAPMLKADLFRQPTSVNKTFKVGYNITLPLGHMVVSVAATARYWQLKNYTSIV